MRRILFGIASVIAILTFSCDTTETSFDDTVPELYTLTTNNSPEGSGVVSPAGGEYVSGTGIEIEANPADGWFFDRWEGDLTGSENPATIVVDEEKNVTAVFVQGEEDQFILNVEVQGQGNVDIDSDQTAYDDGDEVTLKAVPDADWNFTEWQGDLTGNANPETIIMDGDKEITALFELPGAPVLVITRHPAQTTAGTAIAPASAVQLTNDQGDPLPGVDVSVTLNNNAFAQGSTTSTATNNNGFAVFDNLVIETAATEYTLTFDADEPNVSNITSDPFDVVAAAADPANTTADVPDGMAGETTLITISIFDPYDNPVSGAENDLSVTVSGANNASPAATETGTPGEYMASYTPTTAGEDEVAIALNGTPIVDSPFTSNVTTNDADRIEIVSGNNQSAMVGETLDNPLVVRVTDAYDNPVAGETVEFEITETPTGALGQSLSETSVTTGSNGQASTELTLGSMPGTYTVDASAGTAGSVAFTAQAEL